MLDLQIVANKQEQIKPHSESPVRFIKTAGTRLGGIGRRFVCP